MTTTDLAIDLHSVVKTYRGRVRALRDVSMRVGRGEVFGLLGPNGAGKSTLVKILMTIVHPTRCDGRLLGHPIGRKSALARVGYLPEHLRFPDYLTGAQTLDTMAALANIPRRVRRTRAAEMLELVGMTAWKAKKVKTYSKGMKQRLGLAQAMMNDPDLILLDEPTDGVDPVGRRDIRSVMLELKRRGKTVFINSHLLGEVEMVCDRVSILVQGRVAREGTLDELTEGGRRYEIEIESLSRTPQAQQLLEGVARPLETDPPQPALAANWRGELFTGESIEFDGRLIRVSATEPGPIQPILDALRSRGVTIRSVRPVRPSLEDLFIQAVTDPTTGKARDIGADRGAVKEAH